MKRNTVSVIALSAVLLSAVLFYPVQSDAEPPPEPVMLKDTLLAGYLSATVPGLGQAYVGHSGRGFLFFAGTVGAFATAAALYEPAKLKLWDYDKVDFGGDGDGLISALEAKNWEDKEYEDDAFDRLSGGRKAGIITGAAIGVGIYIWNIVDARRLARAHNRKVRDRKVDLGMRFGEDAPQLVMQVRF